MIERLLDAWWTLTGWRPFGTLLGCLVRPMWDWAWGGPMWLARPGGRRPNRSSRFMVQG